MAGVRNNLSYVVINEIVYDGLLPIINAFRTKTLRLNPLRLGDRGAHVLAIHKVPATGPTHVMPLGMLTCSMPAAGAVADGQQQLA